jgi:hypothetical protein
VGNFRPGKKIRLGCTVLKASVSRSVYPRRAIPVCSWESTGARATATVQVPFFPAEGREIFENSLGQNREKFRYSIELRPSNGNLERMPLSLFFNKKLDFGGLLGQKIRQCHPLVCFIGR